jgi:hypothetical protein
MRRGVSEAAVLNAIPTAWITTLLEGAIDGGHGCRTGGIPTGWRVFPFLARTGWAITVY